jgi:putative acetyltransferase
LSAFPTEQEANLIDRLRRNGRLMISLVAESAGEAVGHVAFSAVTIDSARANGVSLAPLAVRFEWQRRGIGAQLVRVGVSACERAGVGFIVLVGEPEYYRRFGFLKARSIGLDNEYGADDAFMALELFPQAVVAGMVRLRRSSTNFELANLR